METAESIRVFARIRPSTEGQPCALTVQEKSLLLQADKNRRETKQFSFDAVFDGSTSQEKVFEVVSRIVRGSLDGYDGTVFAYGQTGSGKTHTVIGPKEDEGIIPRAVALLFDQLQLKQQELGPDAFTYDVKMSFVQLYNERIHDLLKPSQGMVFD